MLKGNMMPKEVTYTYRVAGQLFRLSGDERLLMAAPNMAPFRVPDDSCADADLRFDVTIRTVAALAEPEGVEPFFTDNSEADMPRIEIYRSADEWLFRVAQVADAPVCCEIRMSRDFRRAVLTLQEGAPVHTQRFAIDNAVMLRVADAGVWSNYRFFHAGMPNGVPIANGGTGATTAANARAILGANNASNINAGTLAMARLPFKVAHGSGSVSGNSALTINYSAAGFTSVPHVVASYSTTDSNWSGDNGALKIYSKTTTGATIIVGGSFNTSRNIDWIAIGT